MKADSHFSRPMRREVRTDGALSVNGVMSVDARRESLDHETVTTAFRTLPQAMYEPDQVFCDISRIYARLFRDSLEYSLRPQPLVPGPP